MPASSECPNIFGPNGTAVITTGVREYYLAMMIIHPILIVLFVAVFYMFKETSIFLRKRSFRLLLSGACNSFGGYVAFGIYNYVGPQYFPCWVYVLLVYMHTPLLNIPLMLKIISYHNKVALLRLQREEANQKIRSTHYTSENQEGATEDQPNLGAELTWKAFVAHVRVVFCFNRDRSQRVLSAKFGQSWIGMLCFWTFLSSGPFVIALVIRFATNPQWFSCSGCILSFVDCLILFLCTIIGMAIGLFGNPTFLWRVSRRDGLRIVRECMFSWQIASFLALFAYGLCMIDPYQTYSNGDFDYKSLLLISTQSVIYTQTIQQVVISRWLRQKLITSPNFDQNERFDEVMNNKEYRKRLELFLEAELSAEILKFLDACSEFKKRFKADSNDDNRKRVLKICKTFLSSRSPYEVNLSDQIKRQVNVTIANNSVIPPTVLDEAYDHVRKALLQDGFARYLNALERDSKRIAARQNSYADMVSSAVAPGSING